MFGLLHAQHILDTFSIQSPQLFLGKVILFIMIRFLITLLCFLPVLASAATSHSIHVEWGYTPPSEPAVTGFKLYQEGVSTCQVTTASAKAMDCTVSLTADITNFTLTATFKDGTESAHSAPLAFINPNKSESGTPPTATISSSAATGPSPLSVSFDGSGSRAAGTASITSYAWNFGDGALATGAKTTHTFTSVGSSTTTLTVTDSKGLTGSTSTPVVVTAVAANTNKAPTAVINAMSLTGTAPLTVTFDGSASTDVDGTIASYLWNFGDGGSATGKATTHTYATASNFTATLQVTDDKGSKNIASKAISVQAGSNVVKLNIEVGEVLVTSNWVRVPFSSVFQSPIVVAGPPRFSNSEPCVVRVRNVDKNGFDIRLTEWNYQDGVHPAETVDYIVLEKGRTVLVDGVTVEAGSFTGTTSSKPVVFSGAFVRSPVVLTTIASMNETDTLSGRIKNIGPASFDYFFREQEKNANIHANEAVNYIAWEPGKGTMGSVQFEAMTTPISVTHSWYDTVFKGFFQRAPLLVADMQTVVDTDTAALRFQSVTATGFKVKVEEESSLDAEVAHLAETVGYLALSQTVEQQLATLTWEFDSAQEATITGFQLLVNGEVSCVTNNTSARQLACTIPKPASSTAFAVRAMLKAGGTSAASNTITLRP